jgi:hypothetical protein
MPAPIRIQFSVQGDREVSAAFDSIAARAAKMNQQVANDTVRGTARRVSAEQKASKDIAKAQEQAARAAERATAALAKAQERDAKKAADAQIAASKKANQAALKDFDARAKAATKAGEAIAKAAKKAADDEEKEIFRVARAKIRADAQAARESARIAKQVQAEHKRTARGMMQPVGRAGRAAWGDVTGIAGAAGLTGGGMAIGQALWENVSLREQGALLVNSTRDKGGNATQSVGGLVGESQNIAGKYGVAAPDVMKAMSTVAARAGGAEGLTAFRKDLDDITKTAVAFGVSMEDMGGVVAAALKAGVQPGEEMRQLIQDIAAMGKDGAIEISDLATELARLGGAGKMTELSKGQMLRRQVGIAQVAADAAVSPEQSRTATIDLIRDINTHAGALKKAGVNVYGKNNLVNDPAEVLAQTMDIAMTKGLDVKGAGHLKGAEALNKVFTGTSQQVVASLMADYNKGGKQGVLDRINAASGAKLADGERDAGLKTVLGGDAAQIRVNFEQFKAKMGEALPAFTALIPKVVQLTQSLAQLAVWASKNPFAALGGVFAAHLTKELAGAGIGKVMEIGLQNILAGKSIQAGGNLAALSTIAITATAVYLTGTQVIDAVDKSAKDEGRKQYADVTKAENLMQGPATPEKAAAAAALLPQLRAEKAAADDKSTNKYTKFLAPLLAIPGVNIVPGAAMGAEYAYNKFKQGSREEGSAGSSERLNETIKAMETLAAQAKNASAELEKVKGGNVSNPNDPSRSGKPPGM